MKRRISARSLTALLTLFIIATVRTAGAGGGLLDPSFDGDGLATVHFDLGGSNYDSALSVAQEADGDLVVAGYVVASSGNYDFGVTRVAPDGTIDASFGTGGRATVAFDYGGSLHDYGWSVLVQGDGKIVVAGSVARGGAGSNDRDFGVARLNPDGSLDATFSTGRVVVPFDLGGELKDSALAVAAQADGKLVVVGWAETPGGTLDLAVARLNTDGTLDTSFAGTGKTSVGFAAGGSDAGYAVAIQDDGKIVVAGVATGASGNQDCAFVRFTAAGALDTGFGSGGTTTVAFDLGGTMDDAAQGVTLQSDDKIVAGGYTDTGSAQRDFAAIRLLADGSLDGSFGSGGTFVVGFDYGPTDRDDIASAVAIQDNGMIVLGGLVEVGGANWDVGVARLAADGSLDSSFGTDSGRAVVQFDLGGGYRDSCSDLLLQDDNGIVCVGEVERNGSGDYDFGLVRLTNDLIFADSVESGDGAAWDITSW